MSGFGGLLVTIHTLEDSRYTGEGGGEGGTERDFPEQKKNKKHTKRTTKHSTQSMLSVSRDTNSPRPS